MAVTLTKVRDCADWTLNDEVDYSGRVFTADLGWDSSYPTGGETDNFAALKTTATIVRCKGGISDNGKIHAYRDEDTDQWIALSVGDGKQVPATTDLSAAGYNVNGVLIYYYE